MSYRRQRAMGMAAALVASAVLVACSGEPGAPPDTAPGAAFPGPWGQAMQDMANTAPSEFASQVFADGAITEIELAEATQLVQECYEAVGLTATWDDYGMVSITGSDPDSDDPPVEMAECSFADGGVMVLSSRMRVNPENEDELELRADCLVREGVVEPGYTALDLEQAFERESMPWQTGDEQARACMLDPLGLVE